MENSASSAPGDSPPVSGRRPVMTTSGFPVAPVSATSAPSALSLRAGSVVDPAACVGNQQPYRQGSLGSVSCR
jgi:hypothetical protein